MKIIVAVLALCAFAQNAFAASTECRAVESHSARLACYDAAQPPKIATPKEISSEKFKEKPRAIESDFAARVQGSLPRGERPHHVQTEQYLPRLLSHDGRGRTTMAKVSDYRIITFQRQPGLWRANMTPIVQPPTITRGAAIRGFVTAEDSKSEDDALIAANRAIRELDF